MAENTATPICRGKNLTFETVLAFVDAMPNKAMVKKEFHAFAEKRLKGWTTTHSQIARQLALYYEDENEYCHPRFINGFTIVDIFNYVCKWARLYFIPNPYTPSLKDKPITNIYAFLKQKCKQGEISYKEACSSIYDMELSSLDKVRVYLNNFTDLVISDNTIGLNHNVLLNESLDVHPKIEYKFLNTKTYFEYFGPIVAIPTVFDKSLQQITYGAPGTGKSHGINTLLKTTDHVRTTFHPDSDYSSFVGAYKPTMVKQEKKSGYGDVLDNDNRHEEEELIAYKFVPQAFIKAYVSAWKNYPRETVLVIEEINRGNCAQIFGDLFQLLDRKDNGFSSYPIDADADIAQYLRSELKEILSNEDNVCEINKAFSENYPDGIVEQIKNGTKLLLPNNLYIWATMNTSDQSLFPIDSAFKRRWDWKFVKISDAHKNWTIHFGDEACSWWEFIKEMNKIIAKETSSDDKKLGYFFCKPSNEDKDFISEERFVGKVLFYLWNDVFKDGDTKYFKVSDDPEDEPTFEAFDNDDCTPCIAAIRKFIVGIVGERNIHIIGESTSTEKELKEELDDDTSGSSTWDEKRYNFWSEFLSYANNSSEWAKYFGGVKTPSKGSFKDYSIPECDFHLCTMIRCRDNNAKVAAYWNQSSESYNKLLAHRDEIEAEMGVKYEWNNDEQKTSSNVTETMPNVDFGNEDNWQAVFDFFIDRLLRMRKVFIKYAQMP